MKLTASLVADLLDRVQILPKIEWDFILLFTSKTKVA